MTARALIAASLLSGCAGHELLGNAGPTRDFDATEQIAEVFFEGRRLERTRAE